MFLDSCNLLVTAFVSVCVYLLSRSDKMCQFRPDITVMVDLALKTNFLPSTLSCLSPDKYNRHGSISIHLSNGGKACQ